MPSPPWQVYGFAFKHANTPWQVFVISIPTAFEWTFSALFNYILSPGRFRIFSFLHATRWKTVVKNHCDNPLIFIKWAMQKFSVRGQKPFYSRIENILLAVRKHSTCKDNFYCLVIFRKNAFSDTNDNSTRPYVKVIRKLPPCKNVIA